LQAQIEKLKAACKDDEDDDDDALLKDPDFLNSFRKHKMGYYMEKMHYEDVTP
jgi:hypothetical protein